MSEGGRTRARAQALVAAHPALAAEAARRRDERREARVRQAEAAEAAARANAARAQKVRRRRARQAAGAKKLQLAAEKRAEKRLYKIEHARDLQARHRADQDRRARARASIRAKREARAAEDAALRAAFRARRSAAAAAVTGSESELSDEASDSAPESPAQAEARRARTRIAHIKRTLVKLHDARADGLGAPRLDLASTNTFSPQLVKLQRDALLAGGATFTTLAQRAGA